MVNVSKAPDLERIHCNQCRQRTRHELLHCAEDNGFDEIDESLQLEWKATFETLQCCGCGEVILRRSTFTHGPENTHVQYFPPPVSRHPPTWEWNIPDELRLVMGEIYRSLDADNRRLPMMGARTLVDLLMVEKVGDLGTFVEKIRQLEKSGFISSHNGEVLSAALDAGNAAAHRGHAPSASEVNAVMDIVENLLHAVYVLPDVARKLKKSTPVRPTPKPKP